MSHSDQHVAILQLQVFTIYHGIEGYFKVGSFHCCLVSEYVYGGKLKFLHIFVPSGAESFTQINDKILRARNSKSFIFLHEESKTESENQSQSHSNEAETITHLSEALFLVTVQQGYMHITSDNEEFQPILIRLSITILYLLKGKRLTAKKMCL